MNDAAVEVRPLLSGKDGRGVVVGIKDTPRLRR